MNLKKRKVFQVPVSEHITKHKLAELEHIYQNYPKMVQWFLTIFAKEQLDLSGMNTRHAMDIVEKCVIQQRTARPPTTAKEQYTYHKVIIISPR